MKYENNICIRHSEVKNNIKIAKTTLYVLVIAIIGFTVLILTSCAQIDFSKKAIAL